MDEVHLPSEMVKRLERRVLELQVHQTMGMDPIAKKEPKRFLDAKFDQ
jgi:hypothetical protein